MVDDCSSQKGNVKRLSNDTNGPDIGPDDGISSLDVDHDEQLTKSIGTAAKGIPQRRPSRIAYPTVMARNVGQTIALLIVRAGESAKRSAAPAV